MAWDERSQEDIDNTLATVAHREVLYTTITKLIEAKIHQAFYHSGIAGTSYDPDQAVDYQERLLSAVIEELFKDTP
jgi:primase-polymerase (primpol)-like protein